MKKIYTLILLLMTVYSYAQTPAGNWNLVWEDNFDGNHLDSDKWKMGLNWLGIGSNHVFANSGKSVIVKDGFLTLRGEKRDEIFAGISKPYASAEISTFKQFKQKYGYFEARIKYDAVKGVWPAFWMMPDRGVPQPGPWYADARSYIKFDINSQNTAVTSAKFKVKVMPQTEVDTDHSVAIHKIINNDTWTEENITWNNKPMNDAAFLKQFMGAVGGNRINQIVVGEYLEVDVTDYINAQISGSKQFAGFALMTQFMKQKRVEFGSKENGGITNRPVLVIDGTSIYPSDDAMVRITDPNKGFGSENRLHVCDRWAKTSNTDDGGMEMDIMESLGIWGENALQHALHWDNYGADHKFTSSGKLFSTQTSDGFHTYGMEWSEGKMTFYVDGEETWAHTDTRVSTVESYLILSHQLGGWGGSGNTPVLDGALPADMIVDYVKVYKKNTLAVDTYLDENALFSIAPNPIKDGNLVFKLKDFSASDNVKVNILDVLGRIVYSTSFLSSNEIMNIQLDKKNIKKGIYILQVKDVNSVSTKKFIY